jgi:DNA-3-methyladenine glycosylase
LPLTFYDRPTVQVAKELLGKLIVVQRDEERLARIVETEAYLRNDPASHSYRGLTKRNASMFKGPAILYVFTIHRQNCMNVVTKVGEAVLIRAAEPVKNVFGKTSGPGLLTKALGIGRKDDGLSLLGPPIYIADDGYKPNTIAVSRRIGISRGKDLPLRFYIKGNRFVSR